MDIERVRELCLAMNDQVEECVPFAKMGSEDIAYKIGGKIFAFLCLPDGRRCEPLLVLKCAPEMAIELRERHSDSIAPAWHWNKKYWIQARYDLLSDEQTRGLVCSSYDEVVKKLPKKVRGRII